MKWLSLPMNRKELKLHWWLSCSLLLMPMVAPGAAPRLPGVNEAMEQAIEKREISGAVTMVVTKDRILHCEAVGLADLSSQRPMSMDALFWIASMTKPITAVSVLMLQDEGKLKITDPVANYIPEFADLKTPSGKPANLTLKQMLTHTSGLSEGAPEKAAKARSLAELVPVYLAAPTAFEPGEKWSYNQSGINMVGRVVEVVTEMSFDAFCEKRIFEPLGMKSTTFYPSKRPSARLVVGYQRDAAKGTLERGPDLGRYGFGVEGRPPLGNGGLYSTAPDYARFCQMLLGGGVLDGKRYLSPETMELLKTPQTGDLPTGFFQSAQYGNHGTNYGWGIGTCVLREPHSGVAEMLSPGTFGHGGAWGTQAWMDPVQGVAFILMVQRANFPNSDASDVRRDFQRAVVKAL